MMKAKSFVIVFTIAISFSSGASAGPVTTYPGSMGYGWPNSSKDCFQNLWVEMQNICTDGSHLLIVPLTFTLRMGTTQYADNRIGVRAKGNYHGTTLCTVVECDSNNNCWVSSEKGAGLPAETLYWNFPIEIAHSVQVECLVPKPYVIPGSNAKGGVIYIEQREVG